MLKFLFKLLFMLVFSFQFITCESNVISSDEKKHESSRLFFDIGKWFEVFLKDDDCGSSDGSDGNSQHSSTSNSNGLNVGSAASSSSNQGGNQSNGDSSSNSNGHGNGGSNGGNDNSESNSGSNSGSGGSNNEGSNGNLGSGGSNNEGSNGNSGSNGSSNSNGGNGNVNGESSGGTDGSNNPDKISCRNEDFRIVARCIVMRCNKTEIICKELLMADSCIDRPQAFDIETCIRDVRAEINRLEGPIGSENDSERRKRFLFGLDELIDELYDSGDDDSESGTKPHSSTEASTTKNSVQTTSATTKTTEKTPNDETTDMLVRFDFRKNSKYNASNGSISDDKKVANFDQCQFELNNTKQARCIKSSCEEANDYSTNCVLNAIHKFCLNSQTYLKCLETQRKGICAEDDKSCRIKFNLQIQTTPADIHT